MLHASAVVAILALGWLSGHAYAETTTPHALEAVLATQSLSDPVVDPRIIRDVHKGQGVVWGERFTSLAAELDGLSRAEGFGPLMPPSTGDDLGREVWLSAELLRFGRRMAGGGITPERSYGGFGAAYRPAFDGGRYLKALADGRTLEAQSRALGPPYVAYGRLRDALLRLNAQIDAGGWGHVPDGSKMVPGDSDERVPALRQRLIKGGDLDPAFADGLTMDPAVTEAVRRFQIRHGLEADGTVGARTLAALNVTAESRLRQVLVNMERWRWMPHSLGRHHVAVNIPAASLEVVEDGAVTLSMRVVVGDVKHPTPSLSTTMSTVVLNPAWSVPTSIANKEILPKLRKDPNYLATSNLKIIEYPEDSPESAGDGIDWNAIGKKFPYHLRQPPGPDNALGQLKFNLKDSDDIYMHDTPNRKVFARSYRALSHGCVRLERPLDLGEAMLGGRWHGGRLSESLNANPATRTLRLERTMPVHFYYMTAWAEDDGRLSFREDLYGHDRRLWPLLERAHPTAGRSGRGR